MTGFKAWLIAFIGAQTVLVIAVEVAEAFGMFTGWPWWLQVALGIAMTLVSVGFSLWVERRVVRRQARRGAH